MYQIENLYSSSITLITSRNHQLTLITVKAGSESQNIISFITGWTVYTEKYEARGPDV